MQEGVTASELCYINSVHWALASVLSFFLSGFLPFSKGRIKFYEPAKLPCNAGWYLFWPHTWDSGKGRVVDMHPAAPRKETPRPQKQASFTLRDS